MDSEELKEALATIEYTLQVKLRPTFLAIIEADSEVQEIHIIISTLAFRRMTINERVASIFNLLIIYCPSILKEYLIVVRAHSGDEMEDILEDIFREELP